METNESQYEVTTKRVQIDFSKAWNNFMQTHTYNKNPDLEHTMNSSLSLSHVAN